jgi:hypothetical protein
LFGCGEPCVGFEFFGVVLPLGAECAGYVGEFEVAVWLVFAFLYAAGCGDGDSFFGHALEEVVSALSVFGVLAAGFFEVSEEGGVGHYFQQRHVLVESLLF